MSQLNNINYIPPYPYTLDEYILRYAESFKSRDMDRFNQEQIVRKWEPIIERHFDDINFNKEVKSNLAIYLEICSSYYHNISSLNNKTYNDESYVIFSEIRSKIKKIKSKKSGVIRKVFNYETGFMEYELEDGNFIKINESVDAPKTDVDNSIFPDVFLKIMDKKMYRDRKIDEIL